MKFSITQADTIKAIRKGNREAEFELFGPGFHSKNKVQKSKRKYDRKQNKVTARNCGDFLLYMCENILISGYIMMY